MLEVATGMDKLFDMDGSEKLIWKAACFLRKESRWMPPKDDGSLVRKVVGSFR